MFEVLVICWLFFCHSGKALPKPPTKTTNNYLFWTTPVWGYKNLHPPAVEPPAFQPHHHPPPQLRRQLRQLQQLTQHRPRKGVAGQATEVREKIGDQLETKGLGVWFWNSSRYLSNEWKWWKRPWFFFPRFEVWTVWNSQKVSGKLIEKWWKMLMEKWWRMLMKNRMEMTKKTFTGGWGGKEQKALTWMRNLEKERFWLVDMIWIWSGLEW